MFDTLDAIVLAASLYTATCQTTRLYLFKCLTAIMALHHYIQTPIKKNPAASLRFLKKGSNLYPQLKFFPPIILWRDRWSKKYLKMTFKITKISSTNMSATKLWITGKLRMMLIDFNRANLLMKDKGKRKSWQNNKGKQENWNCETPENTLKLWDLPISKKLMRHFVRLRLWRNITRK